MTHHRADLLDVAQEESKKDNMDEKGQEIKRLRGVDVNDALVTPKKLWLSCKDMVKMIESAYQKWARTGRNCAPKTSGGSL